ncbi:MAG: response regulator [Prolixibacteraceae bacterium]|nr:response regulator [Prolixibacteraceae bacterium]
MLAKRKILIVDDKAGNRLLMKYNLEGYFDIDFANNGYAAINKFKTNHYDLILMDIMMPDMNGVETTKKIRSIENGYHTPIFAITSQIFKDQKRECLDAGMNEYISKPIHIQAIIEKINHYLALDSHTAH